MKRHARIAAAILAVVTGGHGLAAQGQRIQPKDGDVLVVEDGARVKMIRRNNATVRAVYNAGQHWLVILVDSTLPGGRGPDGRVDATYTFNDVTGEWPLGARWDGTAVVDDYSQIGEMGIVGVGLSTPNGVIQLLSPRGGSVFKDPAAVVLSYVGAGRSAGGGESFEQAEAQQVGVAARNAARLPPSGGSFSTGVGMTVSGGGGIVSSSGSPGPGSAPVRVGGNIQMPRRVSEGTPPGMPDAARQAGVAGVVILEITIGTDGAVRDAKILRGIPLLDQAALDTVRQWRYEPTQMNGVAVPVIMTATVNFR
jgi:TonB family protein